MEVKDRHSHGSVSRFFDAGRGRGFGVVGRYEQQHAPGQGVLAAGGYGGGVGGKSTPKAVAP